MGEPSGKPSSPESTFTNKSRPSKGGKTEATLDVTGALAKSAFLVDQVKAITGKKNKLQQMQQQQREQQQQQQLQRQQQQQEAEAAAAAAAAVAR